MLETDRLILRPRTDEDLDACFAMNMEPGTLDFIDFPRDGNWQDPATHRAFIAESHAFQMPDGMGYFTLVTRDNPGRFLGWVLLAPEDMKGPEVEIGWRLITAARGQGFATEAARAIVAHGFGTLGVDTLIADMYRANDGSMGVARKLGMRERPDPIRTTDKYVLWELTRDIWTSGA